MKNLSRMSASIRLCLMLMLPVMLGTVKGTRAQETSNGLPPNNDLVCISQSAANKCFDCFNENKALRQALEELETNGKLKDLEKAVLIKKIDDLEANHALTVSEYTKETTTLRKIIEKLSKRQVSLIFGLIKFRW